LVPKELSKLGIMETPLEFRKLFWNHGYYLSFKISPKILNCIAQLRVRFLMEKNQ
jgi:hypothetical protein